MSRALATTMASSGIPGLRLPPDDRMSTSQAHGEPLTPAVVEEHGKAERAPLGMASSRSSLFGVFRRARPASTLSVASNRSNETFLNAFDGLSVGSSPAALESPKQARASAQKLRAVLQAAEAYRRAIDGMGTAAADLSAVLYEYANTKGCRAGQTALPDHSVDIDVDAAAGLHMLIASHAQVLSQSLSEHVEGPVRRASEDFAAELAARERDFRRTLTSKMASLHAAESRRVKESRAKSRDLDSYRSSLIDLTSQVDDINRAKFDFLGDLHSLETSVAERVHACLSTAVTAEIEVFEGIARKGWSGGGLDGLLAGCPDPFEARGPQLKREDSGSNLFSVLPTRPILPSSPEREQARANDLDDLSHEKLPEAALQSAGQDSRAAEAGGAVSSSDAHADRALDAPLNASVGVAQETAANAAEETPLGEAACASADPSVSEPTAKADAGSAAADSAPLLADHPVDINSDSLRPVPEEGLIDATASAQEPGNGSAGAALNSTNPADSAPSSSVSNSSGASANELNASRILSSPIKGVGQLSTRSPTRSPGSDAGDAAPVNSVPGEAAAIPGASVLENSTDTLTATSSGQASTAAPQSPVRDTLDTDSLDDLGPPTHDGDVSADSMALDVRL